MTGKDHDHDQPVHHAPAPSRAPHHHAAKSSGRRRWGNLRRGAARFLRHRYMHRFYWGTAITCAVATVAVLGLWWRLSSGPISLDIATPWLKEAMEQNFGGTHSVVVGGTQIERDEKGRTSLRLRDIVVRDADGTVVASAPKAEVGLSGMGLLTGHIRAHSLNLVGAEMAVRIESDGRLTVFAGADKRPITTATPALAPAPVNPPGGTGTPQAALRSELEDVAGIMAWVSGSGTAGFDGQDLRELGLKNGNLVVDDRRNDKQWTFDKINASLTRPSQGGVTLRLESDNSSRPWSITAALRPLSDGVRAVGVEARNVSTRDILLAMRINETAIDPDLPLSASIRAEFSPDGTPQVVQGQLVVDAGTIVSHEDESVKIAIDHANFRFNWDARRRTLIVPFQVKSGGNQFTMQATLQAPAADQTAWLLNITRGDTVIDPIILGSAGVADDEGVGINRLTVRGRIDPVRKRIDLDQGDFSRVDTRPAQNIGVAFTGSLDFSENETRAAFGGAGTRMPVAVMKRMWPPFVAADVRTWVENHINGGTVDRIVIAGNAPLHTFKNGGAPTPEDGLSIDIETSGTTVRPIDSLPPIHDSDLTVRITGRTATVNLGRGTVEVSGRKLNVASGIFSVPDTHLKPAPARATARIDGTMSAAAALLSTEALHDIVGLTLDPNTTRGTIAAQLTVNVPIQKKMPKDAATYAIAADLTNFAADNMLLGQKVEAQVLHVTASNDGYQAKGDVKINGSPASIDLHKQKGDTDAELRMLASVDEAARRKVGMDFGNALTGTIPIKLTGRVGDVTSDDRISAEADLTSVKIDDLLPGWVKPAGKPARATYTFVKTAKSTHIDDLTIDGSGASVKGSIELDGAGEVVAANFPVFSLADGDKTTLKAERGGDGVLRVTMRGDVYDGRHFVKGSLGGVQDKPKKQIDLDLDVKIGTVAGYNGETLRGLELRLSRRGGHIRTFAMTSKIGRDTAFNGDLRLRARDNHQVVYFETDDAGSLFRFTDMYPRMYGGQIWVAMDPPSQEETPQVGHVFLRGFAVRGEPALERVVSGAPNAPKGNVDFSEMQVDFTRFPGKMAIRDGVVRGPLIGVTIEGQIDYTKDEVFLRGTFVPFYGLNNMFGQIPIVGLLLGGGSNEGLLGITYEATGPPSAPRISVNPVTAIAPGLLRKFIPSPGSFDRNFVPPTR
jgi:hypothetical protein